MHNIYSRLPYLCTSNFHSAICAINMKKTAVFSFSSLLLLGGITYLAAKLTDFDLTFFFHGDDDYHHYC